MGMNIKDPEVHAISRELAARRSTTVPSAVRQALAAELERRQPDEQQKANADAARRAQLLALLPRFRRLDWPEGVTSKELQDALYDDQGLPV